MESASESIPALAAYRRYGPALIRKAERILHNTDDAGDVVQSLFVELIHNGPARRDGFELPYLYRAVTNRCLNLLRDRQNRERLLERQQVWLRGPARIRCDEEVIGLDLLGKLTDRLDDKHMEILILRFVDDMSQDEIADLCRVSRKTVAKRLRVIGDAVARLVADRELQRGGAA